MKYADLRFRLANVIHRPGLELGEDRLHYLHVPKCGGTTLRYILESLACVRGYSCVNEVREDRPFADGKISMGHERPPDAFRRADTKYMVVLREPVGRLRSFVEMAADRHGRRPADIVEHLTWRQANYAVFLLSGTDGDSGDGVSDAKRALEHGVALFGFQERMTDILRLLAGMFGFGGLVFQNFQTTPPSQQLGPEFDERFHDLTAPDRELYRFALELYADRFAGTEFKTGNDRPEPGRPYLRVEVTPGAAAVTATEVYFNRDA